MIKREMGQKWLQIPSKKLFLWVRRQSKKAKIFLGVVTSFTLVVTLKFFIRKHNHFFVLVELVHFIGLLWLIYKLSTLKTCSGLSLKTQVLTATFLAVRLFCGYIMVAPIHFFLDLVTLVATFWVRHIMKSMLKSSYMADLDSMPLWYLIIEPFTEIVQTWGVPVYGWKGILVDTNDPFIRNCSNIYPG